MKIVHDKIDRKNKGQNKNKKPVPVTGEIGLDKSGQFIFKYNGKAEQRCYKPKNKIFIRKMKYILESKIKKEMSRCAKCGCRKSIEAGNLCTFLHTFPDIG